MQDELFAQTYEPVPEGEKERADAAEARVKELEQQNVNDCRDHNAIRSTLKDLTADECARDFRARVADTQRDQ